DKPLMGKSGNRDCTLYLPWIRFEYWPGSSCHITTPSPEMINNEIKTMERQATGYRDQKFFELQIPAMSGKSYAIVV
ncbi:hypothetical protein, partial [uncultured Phocaeicola sp.]|uniref:hypothetical protein n=1 Tax=uncultured Phocaeicola sp. TaxID=990718 RepID=UPI0025A1FCD6